MPGLGLAPGQTETHSRDGQPGQDVITAHTVRPARSISVAAVCRSRRGLTLGKPCRVARRADNPPDRASTQLPARCGHLQEQGPALAPWRRDR